MVVKTEEELNILREGGARLASIMKELIGKIAPGVSSETLDKLARERIKEQGDTPAFLGYQPHGATRPYPAALCVSVNEEVVHGIPNEKPHIFADGEIVTLDIGLIHKKMITDMAFSVIVGRGDEVSTRLIEAAREALSSALRVARPGKTTGDIGYSVESVAKKYGFSVPRELGGHGVGKRVHEEPFIPNFGESGSGTKLEEGMVLAIEPIIIEGKGDIELADDGYTYRTIDGLRSAQFEHTVVIIKNGHEILTQV